MTLEKALNDINKRFGAGKVFTTKDNPLKVERISTGLITLDEAIGGGIPLGRIIEIAGWESSGKTALCQQIIMEAQSLKMKCAFADMEQTTDPAWFTKTGVDMDSLYITQPDSGNECLDIVEALVKSNELDLIVVDSVSALVPISELEGDSGDANMGVMARMMSQSMRKLTPAVKANNCIVIFTSQFRKNIGGYGSPNVTSGGNALKFAASIRLELARTQTISEATVAIGNKVSVKVRKNKTAPPFQECELRLYFDSGFSKEADLLLYAIDKGIVDKRGAWFSFNDTKEQGETNFIRKLREDKDLYNTILTDIKALKNE